MTIQYTPDTCQCIILMNHDGITFENWVQKCFIHKDADGQKLMDDIFTHNKTFQINSNTSTVVDISTNMKSKSAEKARIQALGAITKRS